MRLTSRLIHMELNNVINDIYFHCALLGDHFDPTAFLADEQFEVLNYHRVGDLAEKGAFKGQIWDYGYVRFKSKTGDFDEFVNKLYAKKDLVGENSIEARELHIFLGYEGQCNWYFDSAILRMISELGLTLTISCAELDKSEAV